MKGYTYETVDLTERLIPFSVNVFVNDRQAKLSVRLCLRPSLPTRRRPLSPPVSRLTGKRGTEMAIYRDGNGKYYFKFSLNGKPYFRRGFSSSSEALVQQSLLIAGGIAEDGKVLPKFNDLVSGFLDRFKESRKITTYVYVRKICLRHFEGHIPNRRVDPLKYSDFESWRKYFDGYAYQRRRISFRGFLGWYSITAATSTASAAGMSIRYFRSRIIRYAGHQRN